MNKQHISKITIMSLVMLTGSLCFAGLAAAVDGNNFHVPEPGMMLLLGSGLAGIVAAYKKFKK